ncbi:MAG: hypothetical protein KDD51_01275 [Bdellovibrionales bacterium]|nr:hypothetical protein [Bdellovibrionales bacterium]
MTKSYRLSDGDVSDRVSFKGRWVKIQSVQNESNLDVRVGIEDTNDTAKEVWLINFKSKTKLTDVLIDGESGARVTQIYFERPQPTHELVGRVKFGDKCLGRAYLVESDQRQACIVSEPLGSPIDFSALGSQLVRLRGYYSSGVFIAQGAILER